MRLRFLGAAGCVTGSRTLVEHEGRRVLVDAGLFQGVKALRLRNWQPLEVDAASLDAVVLTHAHLDHSGFLPRLVRLGFRGAVHCTGPTRDLCGVLLPDSARLMVEEAAHANRHGWSRHHPALPLFDEDDARRALERLQAQPFERDFAPVPGLQARFTRAGHILGAASVRLEAGGRSVLFSGDLGRSDDLLLPAPAAPPASDTVVVESTYGDRRHPEGDPLDALADAVARTAARGGLVLVPAFAVARAQALLLGLARLKSAHRIPDLPVFLDSPMAAGVTDLYRRWHAEHRIDEAECASLGRVATVVDSVEASKRLNDQRFPAVIVAGSGMATGGRIVFHLAAHAGDPRNTVLLAGFQAPGTRGAALAAGARTLRIHGRDIAVRAEVVQLEGLSAHADAEGLIAWLAALPRPPRRVLVNHGEPVAADALRQAIERRLGWPAEVAGEREAVEV